MSKKAVIDVPSDSADVQGQIEGYLERLHSLDGQLRVLEHDKQKFAAVVERSDAGFFMAEPDQTVSWCNERLRVYFSPDTDIVGLRCNDVVCHLKNVCADCPSARAHKSGAVAHHELLMGIGGRFRNVYASGFPLLDRQGKVQRTMVMLQDLSELRALQRTEEALRTSEKRSRSIFDEAGAGLLSIKADGSFLQANPAFCVMVGYTESELVRKTLIELTHPDDVDEFSRALNEGIEGKSRVMEREVRLVRRDGTSIWCSTTTVWQFEKDTPAYGVSLVQDISQRRRAQQELERSQQRYEGLVHSIDGIVWEAEPKTYNTTFVSRQAEQVLGFPVERWLTRARFWKNQLHPDDLEGVLETVENAISQQRGTEFEYRMISADGGTVWIRHTLSVVEEKRDKIQNFRLRGVMVDITDKKEAEEALIRSAEQLRQSQKMEAIGRLAGGIAHDFNNLLTAMTGYGEFLLRGLGKKNKLRREAEEVMKAARRASELTGQLLAFSRQQVLQPKILELNSVVDDMETMLRRVIGEDIELITDLGTPAGKVKADPGQLHQVVLNLAVNARDAMPEGGKIFIETSIEDVDAAYCEEHPTVDPGSYVTLAVADTGCGMSEETKQHLFEPFFTTKEAGKGTGLGLATVYGIVKQSGGHLLIFSELGEGSTFKIFLPRIEGAVPTTEVQEEVIPDLSPGTETILLVEDDDAVRDLTREILEMNGYTVIEARNGVEALKICQERGDIIELVISDLVMPEMGGRELAKKAADFLDSSVNVLFLSGYTASTVMQQGILDPGSFFLQKPFTPAGLAKKVRQILDG